MSMILKVCVLQIVLGTVIYGVPEVQHQGTAKYYKAMPYAFAYGVKDDYAGTHFDRNEKSNGNEVIGSYSVQLPDGRKQIVTYKADHYNGFRAEVTYKGLAHYPPPSKYPPFTVKPSYHHHNHHQGGTYKQSIPHDHNEKSGGIS